MKLLAKAKRSHRVLKMVLEVLLRRRELMLSRAMRRVYLDLTNRVLRALGLVDIEVLEDCSF